MLKFSPIDFNWRNLDREERKEILNQYVISIGETRFGDFSAEKQRRILLYEGDCISEVEFEDLTPEKQEELLTDNNPPFVLRDRSFEDISREV